MLRLVFLIVSFSSPSWFGRCSCFLCESEQFFLITGIPKVPPWCERIRGQRSLVHIPEAQLSLDCVGLNFIGLESRSPSLFSDTLGCSPKRKKKQCCYIGFLAEWEWMIRKGRFFFFLAELRITNSLFIPKRGPCKRKTLRVLGSKDGGCSGGVGGTKLLALLF